MCMQERISLLLIDACNLSAMFSSQNPTQENCFLRNYYKTNDQGIEFGRVLVADIVTVPSFVCLSVFFVS